MRSLKIVFIVANITFISAQAAEIVKLDNFQNESVEVPSPWRIIQLNKKIAPTLYKIKRWDDVLAIEATANNSMALLAVASIASTSSQRFILYRVGAIFLLS